MPFYVDQDKNFEPEYLDLLFLPDQGRFILYETHTGYTIHTGDEFLLKFFYNSLSAKP